MVCAFIKKFDKPSTFKSFYQLEDVIFSGQVQVFQTHFKVMLSIYFFTSRPLDLCINTSLFCIITKDCYFRCPFNHAGCILNQINIANRKTYKRLSFLAIV